MSTEQVSRTDVQAATACPRCGAQAGQRCRGVRGKPRRSCHTERWERHRQEEAEAYAAAFPTSSSSTGDDDWLEF